jgi:plasmid stability protein
MGQILVRDLDDRIVKRLKARARRKGHSLQAEVKSILERQAAVLDPEAAWKLVDTIRMSFGNRRFDDSARLIRKDRDRR